jgi:hypothetical protein
MILQEGKLRFTYETGVSVQVRVLSLALLAVFGQRLLRFYITSAAKTRYFDARAPCAIFYV